MPEHRRKLHRLPREHYRGKVFLSITACERNRQPLLANNEVHEALKDHLERAAAKHTCRIPVYCLMPDHLHILVQGIEDYSDTLGTSDHFKLLSGKWFKRKLPHLHWQESSFDHIVRNAEGWESQARYIALNPVKKGLVESPEDWPYTGSIGYDLTDILDEGFHP